jgi:hypothetical protein
MQHADPFTSSASFHFLTLLPAALFAPQTRTDPAHASLHDVIRTIWNDHAGFSPEFRENHYLRALLNNWNDWNV